MRIPPSVFVMSVVTAVPFGLGIRDTLKQKAVSADEYGSDLDFGSRDRAARDRAYAEYEAEARREAADREAKSVARIAQLDQLFGDKPAQMGSLFDGIVLGAGAGTFQPDHVRQRIERTTRDGFITVQFDADAKTLNAVDAVVNSDYDTSGACDKLDDKLVAKWGTTTNRAWLDPATHQRATFDSDSCRLRFERYLDPADWVAQLPLTALGMSAETFGQQTLGGNYEEDGEHMFWTAPGVGYGKSATRFEAFVKNGKIVGFQAASQTDFDSTLAIRDAISTKLKAQPKTASDDSYDSRFSIYEWKKRVPVSLETSGSDRFTVLVGAMPWD